MQPASVPVGLPEGEGEEGAPGEVVAHQLALGGGEHVGDGVEVPSHVGVVLLEAAAGGEGVSGLDGDDRGEKNNKE